MCRNEYWRDYLRGNGLAQTDDRRETRMRLAALCFTLAKQPNIVIKGVS
jgi:hypothetical protein